MKVSQLFKINYETTIYHFPLFLPLLIEIIMLHLANIFFCNNNLSSRRKSTANLS